MSYLEHNRDAWNKESIASSEWAIPVDSETIARARSGDWSVILTPLRAVPREWFGELAGKDVLCLASGGGQQSPTLAAAGARVVSFDLSDEQLAKDRFVADRDGLEIETVRGDMADLSVFPDSRFDLIFHPISNVFVPDVEVVWRECFRVLRPGGVLLAGFMNPAFYLFDHDAADDDGRRVAKHTLPYSEIDPATLDAKRREDIENGAALEFSHTLDAQIGGQLAAGFMITGLFEDGRNDDSTPIHRLMKAHIATRAIKLG